MDFKDMKYIARQDIFYTISGAEVKRRHDAVRALLQAHDVGVALLLCRDGNARNWVCGGRFGGYLSGGDGLLSGADILLAQGDMYITSTVDGFTQWASGERASFTPYLNPGVFSLSAFDAALIRDGFQSAGNRRLGFIYPDNMDVALSAYLEEQIGAYEAVDLSAEFSLLQMVHSPEEIGLFRDAVRMHEQVFRALPAVMHSGMSETECVNLLRDVFYRCGCGDLTRWIDCWTDLISNPDGMPLSGEEVLFPGRILQKGDRIDVAVHAIGPNAVYAMCARSFLLGDAPAAETQALWETAVGAQQAAAAALCPGATVKAAAEAANSYLRAHGAAEDVSAFIHAVGYGMDERPRLWDDSENMPLQAGMVLAVMPTADNGRVAPLCCGDVFVVTETGAQRLGTLEQEIFPVYGVY